MKKIVKLNRNFKIEKKPIKDWIKLIGVISYTNQTFKRKMFENLL